MLLALISRLALTIDDQNLASHYICVASQLYTQKPFSHDKVYGYILNYLSAEKVCAGSRGQGNLWNIS